MNTSLTIGEYQQIHKNLREEIRAVQAFESKIGEKVFGIHYDAFLGIKKSAINMKTPPTLPDKPSELVRVARRDLKAVMNQPRKYVVNMANWHAPDIDGRCRVCQAGAVMANTLKIPVEKLAYPSDAAEAGDWLKLLALNRLRQNQIADFFAYLDVDFTPPMQAKFQLVRENFVPFESNPGKYLSWLLLVEKTLKECGL